MSNKNLSRRSFLKGAAVSALGLAAVPALGLAEEKAAYTPGAYSAVVKAYGGFITATLTFSETAITDCVIDAACETPSIGGVAAEEMAKAVLAEQKADVASSASAAITVPAVKKAVNNCIAQAMGLAAALNEKGADEGDDWLGQAPEIDDAQIASVQETDLLIIGAGNGGMMAAATAADAGMNFIVAEQNAVMGDTRHWIGAVDTKQMNEAGVEVKKDRLLNEIARYASYKCDMDLIKMWIQNSGEMIAYLESLGMQPMVNIAPESHVGGSNMEYYVPSIWHTVNLPEGCELKDRHAFLEDYIGKKGYKIQYSMTLVKLVQNEAGAVTGAIFIGANGVYVKINAKNTILATGGYPGNPKMIKALAPIVTECVTANSYYAPNVGMGIRAGIWAGAKMDTEPAPMVFDRGLVAPGVKAGYVDDGNGNLVFPAPMGQFIIGTQPFLKVNKEGYRFANESCPYDFMNFAASLQTDGVYASIVDSSVNEDIIAYDQYGCAQIAVNIARGGAVVPMIEQQVAAGLIMKADTIEELAEKLGIPADALKATVDRYNELAEKGVDEDFGKEAYRLRPVVKAPFYGFFMGGSLLCTCDGLRINRKCQVYDTNHKIIEGLYAVGNCSGGFFSGNYPEYFVGVGVGRTMTQGRYAVKAILGETV